MNYGSIRVQETGEVCTEFEYRCRFPATSFAVDAAPPGTDRVARVPAPAAPAGQQTVLAGVELADGEWREAWSFGPLPVPQEVSRRRGLEALFRMYSLKDVDIEAKIMEVIENEDERYVALSEFRTSQIFERNRAMVVLMGTLFDLDLDALFVFADSLP